MSLLALLALALVSAFLVSRLISIVNSPLRHIPAFHPLARLSPIPILLVRYFARENSTLLRAHKKNGHVVLLSPTELSANSPAGLRTIYTAGWPKHPWYMVFTNYSGTTNMFTMLDSSSHSKRKRIVSGVYAKSALLRSAGFDRIEREMVKGELLDRLNDASRSGEGVEVGKLLGQAAMDGMSAFIFGREAGTRYIGDDAGWDEFQRYYTERGKWAFWTQELPDLEKWLGVAERGSRSARAWVDSWCSQICDRAAEVEAKGGFEEREADVWKALRKATHHHELASEVLDHLRKYYFNCFPL